MRKVSYVVNGVTVNSYDEARRLQPIGQLEVKLTNIVEKKKTVPNYAKIALDFYNKQ